MGGQNTLCVDEGNLEIDNEIDCTKAIESKGWKYKGTRNKSFTPKGCTTDVGGTYNKHPVGGRYETVSPICITPGNLSYP